jgi:hypothetical protein
MIAATIHVNAAVSEPLRLVPLASRYRPGRPSPADGGGVVPSPLEPACVAGARGSRGVVASASLGRTAGVAGLLCVAADPYRTL